MGCAQKIGDIISYFFWTSQHLGRDLATGVLGGENAESPPQAPPEAKARRRRIFFAFLTPHLSIFSHKYCKKHISHCPQSLTWSRFSKDSHTRGKGVRIMGSKHDSVWYNSHRLRFFGAAAGAAAFLFPLEGAGGSAAAFLFPLGGFSAAAGASSWPDQCIEAAAPLARRGRFGEGACGG